MMAQGIALVFISGMLAGSFITIVVIANRENKKK